VEFYRAISGIVGSCGLTCLRSGHSHEDVDQLFGSLAKFLCKRGQKAEVPEDFRVLIGKFLDELHRPFEKGKYSILLEQSRPWPLRITMKSLVFFVLSCVSEGLKSHCFVKAPVCNQEGFLGSWAASFHQGHGRPWCCSRVPV